MGFDFIRSTVRQHRKAYAAQADLASQDWIATGSPTAATVCRATTTPDERFVVGEAVMLRQMQSGEVVASRNARAVGLMKKPSKRLVRYLEKNCGVATAEVHGVFPDALTIELKLEP